MEKLMFHEAADGELSAQVQRHFEEAQAISHARGVKTKVLVEITIHPEKTGEERGTAEIEFQSRVSAPAKKSMKYLALVNKEGVFVTDDSRQQKMGIDTKERA